MKITVEGGDVAKNLEALKAQLEYMTRQEIAIGVPNKENERRGTSNLATIAAALEYGTSRIPARPFLRETLSDNLNEYADMLNKLRGDSKESAIQAMRLVAAQAQADVQENMIKGEWAPNSEAVYKRKLRKGSNGGEPRPLVDTGRLRQSIKGVVIPKEE